MTRLLVPCPHGGQQLRAPVLQPGQCRFPPWGFSQGSGIGEDLRETYTQMLGFPSVAPFFFFFLKFPLLISSCSGGSERHLLRQQAHCLQLYASIRLSCPHVDCVSVLWGNAAEGVSVGAFFQGSDLLWFLPALFCDWGAGDQILPGAH